ncbi:Erg28-like protein, partial [Clavulina sp. PMI_390]
VIPQTPGWLPKWQLFVATLALFNTVQNFTTTALTKRVYSNAAEQVTALQSRTFGIWTLTAAMVRIYCAYHINDPTIYQMTLWTYVIVLAHYGSELIVFRSVKLNAGFLSPLVVGGASFIWMLAQQSHYTS